MLVDLVLDDQNVGLTTHSGSVVVSHFQSLIVATKQISDTDFEFEGIIHTEGK